MEYRIHHLNLVEPTGQQFFFEEEIQNNIPRLQQIFLNYPGKPVLHIFIKKEGTDHYRIFASLHLNRNDILVKEEGPGSMAVVNNVLDKLCSQVKKQLQMERKEYLLNRKNRITKMADSFFPQMKEHIERKDETAFINLAREVLPEVETYVQKAFRRKPALARLVKKKLITTRELVDEIYTDLYADIQKQSSASENIISRVLFLSEKKVSKREKEYAENFPDTAGSAILSKQEMDDINKSGIIISDANPKQVLEEDLDEKYFVPGEYDLSEILTDAGAGEEIILKAEHAVKHSDIFNLLADIPEEQQSVFEMHYIERFTIEEIAYIRQYSESFIEKILDDTRFFILLSVKSG